MTTRVEAESPLSEKQLARVAALRAAREILAARGVVSGGTVAGYEAVQVAGWILDGVWPNLAEPDPALTAGSN